MRVWTRLIAIAAALLAPLAWAAGAADWSGPGGGTDARIHNGVASCAGSTCHARQEPNGKVVRQNELITWQDESSSAGAHSRSYRVLFTPRSEAIAQRLGIGPAGSAPMCLGCHTDNVPASQRGARFQITDGVGCEACHGGSQYWLASHTDVAAGHARNVSQGMIPLDQPRARAELCLNCHFGSEGAGQFVDHRIMSAGHPRIAFELDLFTALQAHHDEDADYRQRKQAAGGVKTWAIGQTVALERSLALYSSASRGSEGAFPEFYFFDCHSCHRRISDDPAARPTAIPNPGRPIPSGMPPYNDENMIMLSAAARTMAPGLAARFDGDSRAFHAAIAQGRPASIAAAARLSGSARALGNSFAAGSFGRGETMAMLNDILAGALVPRYTDYTGSAQAVMAADTLLNALVNAGQADRARATAIHADLDAAYRAVRDPNAYRPADFRAAMARAAASVRSL